MNVPDSVLHIGVSDQARALLKGNQVIVREKCGTYAESFARKNHLTFLHSDMRVAHTGNSHEHGVCFVDLMFRPGGRLF